MATKNNPGKFDCYTDAEPDEPMFVLLGRDPCAGALVFLWSVLRVAINKNTLEDAQIAEALECANAMSTWAADQDKSEQLQAVRDILARIQHALESSS